MLAILLRWLIIPVVFLGCGAIAYFRVEPRSAASLVYPAGAFLGALFLAIRTPPARTSRGIYLYAMQALCYGVVLFMFSVFAFMGTLLLLKLDPSLSSDPKRLATFVGLICGLVGLLWLLGEKYGRSMAGERPHDEPHM